jgi:MFS family permease
MLPLVGDLAPPHRRATALSIVVSGLLLGMLLARLLSGILTQFTSWRSIYFLSLGLQYAIFILLWLFMPDYPSTNPGGLNYFGMLWSMVTMLWAEPVLAQACIIGFMTSTTFTSFWTTLTFLLAGKPYEYSPITIGLFALIGIAAMAFGPFYCKFPYVQLMFEPVVNLTLARVMIDRFPPLWSVVLGLAYNFIGLTLGTFIGPFRYALLLVFPFLCLRSSLLTAYYQHFRPNFDRIPLGPWYPNIPNRKQNFHLQNRTKGTKSRQYGFHARRVLWSADWYGCGQQSLCRWRMEGQWRH